MQRPCLVDAIEQTACSLADTTCICQSKYINVMTTACVGVNCTVLDQLSTSIVSLTPVYLEWETIPAKANSLTPCEKSSNQKFDVF